MEKREIGQVVTRIEKEVEMPGANVSGSSFKKYGPVEAFPDIRGGVDQVLDMTGDGVDCKTGGVGGGLGMGVGERRGEGGNVRLDRRNFGRDEEGGGLHEDNGIGGVDEVSVEVANQLAEFLLLVIDLFSGGVFGISYFRNGFGAEEGLSVSESSAGRAVVGGYYHDQNQMLCFSSSSAFL